MALLCDWITKVITVPKTDLTLVSGTDYTLDVIKWFELLRTLNGDAEGIAETVREPLYNNTPPTSSTPRIVNVINGYTCQMENGLYNVDIINGNSNWREVEIKNQVGVSTNNTTGFINPTFLEHSLFEGGVTIDTLNGYPASFDSLVGTSKYPSSNEAEANAIALTHGFKRMYVVGDLLLDDTEVEWTGFEFIGESAIKTLITIEPEADVFNCEFIDCTVTGTLDGTSQIERGVITNLDFVNGYIYKCAIGPVIISLGTSTICNMFSCYSTVPGSSTPEIDMNSTGVLALRDYNGGILLKNYNGNGSHSIDLARGQVKFDTTTIISGTFIVRGVGKLIDELGNPISTGVWNGAVNVVNELVTQDQIQQLIDLAESDEEKNVILSKYYKRHKTSKEILVEKNYNIDGNNNETLIE